MKESKIKIIIFDFDGTLADSREYHKRGLINSLTREGIKVKKREINHWLGKKTSEILHSLNISKNKTKAVLKDINEEKNGNVKKIHLIGQTKQVLHTLNTEGYKLIILSNAETNFIKKVCKINKIDHYFLQILGEEKFTNKASAIKKILKKYHANKNQVVFIGDRYSDIIYGNKAGVISIAVSNRYSWSSKEDLLKHNPIFLINNIKDITKITNSFSLLHSL